LGLDGTELTRTRNVSQLLNDKVDETVVLLVSTDPKASLKDRSAVRRVELKAIRRNTDPRKPDEVSAEKLLYERWVEKNARRVAELSKGKLGYIHIPSMNEEGL